MNCLWCHEEIIPEITWSNLFQLEKRRSLCSPCEELLEPVEGERCKGCSRHETEEFCSDCLRWKNNSKLNSIEFNYSVFVYNKMMQEIIAKWKYRGDYALGEIFRAYFVKAYKQRFSFLGKEALAIPIPLSKERLKERGFNQADVLTSFLPVNGADILSRKHGEKQSKKTRYERIYTENPFYIDQPIKKTVILVDDIYTTGTTLRHAAALLKEQGCPAIYAFTLIRG